MHKNLLLLLGSNFYKLNSSLQEEIYREFYQFLYTPIMYMIQDHPSTEDIIQEAFMITLKKVPPVENEEHLRAWIKVVAKNLTITYIRKRKRNLNDLSLEGEWANAHSLSSPNAMSVEKEIEVKTLEEKITQHLLHMKPDQRAIIEMKWKHGLSYKEIATEIQDSENAVRRKLHRARIFLKKKLRMDWGDSSE